MSRDQAQDLYRKNMHQALKAIQAASEKHQASAAALSRAHALEAQAAEALIHASFALDDVVSADYGDLRETVRRLEATVRELVAHLKGKTQ